MIRSVGVSIVLVMIACCNGIAQDTLTLWGGSKKVVHITRMDHQCLYYKKRMDSKHERFIDKEKLMDIGSRDSASRWEELMYSKGLYGMLPTDPSEIDRMAGWQVDYFYHGDKIVGSRALFSTIIGTPIIGLGYSLAQSTKKVPVEQLGLMGNPHADNTIYLESYAQHAQRKNKKKAWGNWAAGSLVYIIPLGLAAIAVQSMSFGSGF